MNVKKCDRCKIYYDENKKHKARGPIADGALTGITLLDKNGRSILRYDLCDSCLTALKKFLKNE